MGTEYVIRYQPPGRPAWEAFAAKLDNPLSAEGWPAFALALTDRGVYFCDHGRSPAAAVALRRIVDEVLSHTRTAVIEALE